MQTAKRVKQIELYTPTEYQLNIHTDIDNRTANIYLLVCGRRWGKNIFGLNDCIKRSLENQNKNIWWCSPVYRQAKRDYRRLKTALKSINEIKKSFDSELRIELDNNTVIEFHGLEDHENLLGEGLDYLYIDEMARIKKEAWENTLSPMLLDNEGIAIGFTTPKGKGWFYQIYLKGLSNEDNIKSYHFTTYDNPYINKNRLDSELSRLPKRVIEQEYYAKFLDAGSGVFAGYNECIDGELLSEPEINSKYKMGVDLAKHQDFTVITVIDIQSKQVVFWRRFQDYDYNIQKRIIYETARKWNNAEIVIDSTGVGEPVYDDLMRAGLHITPYKFTNASKINLIENLIVAIQNKSIRFPDIPELLNELDVFEYNQTPSGTIRYSSPEGYHDDCVISLALCIVDLDNFVKPETAINLNAGNRLFVSVEKDFI